MMFYIYQKIIHFVLEPIYFLAYLGMVEPTSYSQPDFPIFKNKFFSFLYNFQGDIKDFLIFKPLRKYQSKKEEKTIATYNPYNDDLCYEICQKTNIKLEQIKFLCALCENDRDKLLSIFKKPLFTIPTSTKELNKLLNT